MTGWGREWLHQTCPAAPSAAGARGGLGKLALLQSGPHAKDAAGGRVAGHFLQCARDASCSGENRPILHGLRPREGPYRPEPGLVHGVAPWLVLRPLFVGAWGPRPELPSGFHQLAFVLSMAHRAQVGAHPKPAGIPKANEQEKRVTKRQEVSHIFSYQDIEVV